MTIKKGKNKIIHNDEEKNTVPAPKTMRPLKRSSSQLNSGKKLSFKKYYKNKMKMKNEIVGINPQNQNKENKENNEVVIKDIELNLDKYIFNFDETVLKFINKKEVYKENFVSNNNNHDKKFNINFGTLELTWVDKDGLINNYKFDKKISRNLFKSPQIKWRLYVENNINTIITGANKRNALSKKISLF